MRNPWNRNGVRTWLVTIGVVAAFLLDTSSVLTIAVGTALLLSSMTIQFWSKGYLHQDREVTQAGPYRFVRHPFYFGNLLLDAGIVLMSGFWPLILAWPVWWFAIYIPVMRGEEATLESLFGDRYADYKARVPMFLPLRWPLPLRPASFDWSGHNILGAEVPRAIRYLSYPLLFLLAARASPSELLDLGAFAARHLLLIASIAAVTLTSWVWKRHFRSAQSLLPALALRPSSRLAFLLLVIAFGGTLDTLDAYTASWRVWLPGPFLLAISVYSSRRRAIAYAYLAEATLAISMAFLFELPWLSVLLVPLYLALTLDARLPVNASAVAPLWRSLPAGSYLVLVSIGIATVVAADMFGP